MFALGSAKPISGTASTIVKQPLATVFDFIGHGFFENYTRWSPQVVEFEPLSSGPARLGAAARQVTLDRGVRTESTFEIAAFGPPKVLGVKGLSEPFRSRYEFEGAADGATRVSFHFELEERRLAMRPFRSLLRESLEQGARRTVDNLKKALESDYAAANSPERLARFVYVASLDLEEPLRKIAAFSDLLDNAMASENKADMAYAREAMRRYAASARKMVDDLLTYSGTILGDRSLEILDLRTEIDAVLGELKDMIAETKSRIDVRLPPLAFLADRAQFSCLVTNIVTNAIKYRKPGEGAKVEISAELTERNLMRLVIADRGVGFNEEFAQAVFEPFKRMPGRTEYPGTGIELAICKSIADRHGWGISVQAKPGEGAAFLFSIPTLGEDRMSATGGDT